ncbi:O-antigen ligase family protein [Patescibacteria group bacterium]
MKPHNWVIIGIIFIVALVGGFYFLEWLGGLAVIVLAIMVVLTGAIMRNPFIGLLAIVVALPFEWVGSIDISGLTLRISQVLLIITATAWLLNGLINKRLEFKSNPIFYPLIVFVIINLLSFTQAVNLKRAAVVLAATILTMLLAGLIPQLIDSLKKAKLVLRVLFVITIIVTLFGIYQFIGDLIGLPQSLTGLRDLYTKDVFGFPRIQGTALEPLYFVNFLILPITLAFAFLISREKVMNILLLAALLLLGVINVVLALSRAGWVALAVSLVIVGIYYFRKLITPRQFIIGLLIVLITAYVFIRVFGLTEDVEESFAAFGRQSLAFFEGASFTDRVSTFTDAWVSFKMNPWLGIGTGNFGPIVALFPAIEPVGGWLIVNNIFLEIAVETGIFGLAVFILILGILFIRSIKAINITTSSWLRAALIGSLAALAGVMVQYQTFSILFIMHIWFLFGWLIALQNLAFTKRINQ